MNQELMLLEKEVKKLNVNTDIEKAVKDWRGYKPCSFLSVEKAIADEDYAVDLWNANNCFCCENDRNCKIHELAETIAFIVLEDIYGCDL